MPRIDPDRRDAIVAAIDDALGARAAAVFARCFDDTLDNTITDLPDGTAFVVTGDIPAMWLRDSAAQLTPYVHFAAEDAALAGTIARVVARQLAYIRIDPYANAFNREPGGAGHADLTERDPWVWERKYEVDSLCYPLLLATDLWRATGDLAPLGEPFLEAARVALALWRREQRHDEESPYRFQRPDGPASDSLRRDGLGEPTAYTGLTWSAFRPSDDAVAYGYNIPGNAFAVVACRAVAEVAPLLGDDALARAAAQLADQLDRGIREHGIVTAPTGDPVLAYEVDGRGGALLMDDANVPSLLSLPLLGWCAADDPLYLATRAFVLSEANPTFASGPHATGVGSPHTPDGWVWPLALAVQGLTSRDHAERRRMLDMLVDLAGDGLFPESLDPADPARYTREWFSWPNAMFCELALDLAGLRTVVRRPAQEASRP